jgi:hypothetical protein
MRLLYRIGRIIQGKGSVAQSVVRQWDDVYVVFWLPRLDYVLASDHWGIAEIFWPLGMVVRIIVPW